MFNLKMFISFILILLAQATIAAGGTVDFDGSAEYGSTPPVADFDGSAEYGTSGPSGAAQAAAAKTVAARNGGFQPGSLSPQCYPDYTKAMSQCSGAGQATVLAGAIAGGATTVIVNNNSNGQANGDCKIGEATGVVNTFTDAYQIYQCRQASSDCQSSCDGSGTTNPAQKGYDQAAAQYCQSVQAKVQTMGLVDMGKNALTTVMSGRGCGAQTNPNAPMIPGGPGYQGPQAQEPENIPKAVAGPNTIAPQSSPTDGGTGGSGLPGGAPYPGGAAVAQAKNNEGSAIASPALGLASGGGGGGGWPSGTVGGNGAAPNGGAPFDLSALLPGHAGDPSRTPASVASEVTGPNDLSNFQKVTRMMNKKRPVLKSGEGA